MKKDPNKRRTLAIRILTIFPDAVLPYFGESLFKRARDKGIVRVEVENIRDYAAGKHKKVDDTPYGGGPGMVMLFEPIAAAVRAARQKHKRKTKTRVILLSTRGEELTEATAQRLAAYDELILICGRYEGVDERIADTIADEELSIGAYILSGGELPAMVVADAVSRKIPGFLGRYASLEEIKGSYPVYTRPPTLNYKGRARAVPGALLGGDHKMIQAWRKTFGKRA